MEKPLGSENLEAVNYLIKTALTISPPDIAYLSTAELFERHKRLLSNIQSSFILYPELDEKGRLHYHGYLYKDHVEYKFDLDRLRKIGYICLKPIHNVKAWNKYIKKEWKTTKRLLKIKKPVTKEDCMSLTTSYDLNKYGILVM